MCVAKELRDYLERRQDTLLRQVGSLTEKWPFFYIDQSEDILWLSLRLTLCLNYRYIEAGITS